jgi:TolA-binding protein
MRNWKIIDIHISIFLLFIGCASYRGYYNTFYNAKQYYKDAMKPTPPSKELLDKSIQKCEKLVKFYPKSGWVDDALFLMGECFLEKGEYDKAETKFNELISYYPESEFVDNAYLNLGRLYFEKEEYVKAREYLMDAIKQGNREIVRIAQFYILKTYFASGEYNDVITYGEKLDKTKRQSEEFLIIGSAYDSLKNYSKAVDFYQMALRSCDKKFSVLIKIGDALFRDGKTDEAKKKFLELQEIATKDEERRELSLRIGKCLVDEQKYEDAIKALSKYSENGDNLYEIASIYENYLFDLEKARENYDKVRNLSPNSELGRKALIKSNAITDLIKYRDEVKEETSDELAKTRFLLAELYFLEFNRIDDALTEYRKVVDGFPESEYAPKALYSIAWIEENKKKNMEEAMKLYRQVEEKYPGTDYSFRAGERIKEIGGR